MEEKKLYKILVVDDEKDNLDGFVRVFKKNFDLLSAESGKEALEILKKESNIGVVVADQRMDEMTGVELLSKVKETYPEIVRIVLTGYSDFQVPIDAINKGDVFRYLQKPVEKDLTHEALADGLAKYDEILQLKRDLEGAKKRIQQRFFQVYESLAAGITHHVNNGLVPAKTFLSMVSEKVNEVKEGKYDASFFDTFLQEALTNLEKVENLTQMLLWVHNCKIEEFSKTQVETLIDFENSAFKELVKRKNISMKKKIASDLPDVIVDPAKVREMLSLLLKNCVAAAPEGSSVSVEVNEKKDDVDLDQIEVRVSYKGRGYKSEEVSRLFDPFYRFDEKLGTGINGLELTNCFIIAIKHGCELKVESQPKKETAFIVKLPTSSSNKA